MKDKLMTRVSAEIANERRAIEQAYEPDAREWFRYLRERLLASRPVIGTRATFPRGPRPANGALRAVTEPIYGRPTFQNRLVAKRDGQDRLVLDERGRIQWEHV